MHHGRVIPGHDVFETDTPAHGELGYKSLAMNILSIQSHVAFGHVGNAAATFPLQRLGIEVWPIHTVQFSNHTGYGSWKGRVFDAGMIREVVAGIEARGVLGECNGVLSGYMGAADIGAAIFDAVATVKRAACWANAMACSRATWARRILAPPFSTRSPPSSAPIRRPDIAATR